jgi:peptidoglycan/xylan/chitin deacetylase (PgdA/CDA1 family)
MQWARERAFITLSLRELIDDGVTKPDRSLIITFDDGWEDNYRNAFPVLAGYSMQATLFVSTGSVGSREYLDWSQLIDMDKGGVSVQSHTVSHRGLVDLPQEEVVYELEASKKTIEDRLAKTVEFLSLPHGVMNKRVIDLAGKVGYRGICTSEPRFSHRGGNPAILNRINMSEAYSIDTFGRILAGREMPLLPARVSKAIKNTIRRAIGFRRYRGIYEIRYRPGPSK